MQPLFCNSLWHWLTVRCDGSLTCGLEDPFKIRDFGNLKNMSVREAFNSPPIKELRVKLQDGFKCVGCQMYTSAQQADHNLLNPSHPYPRTLVIEPSIKM